jgi:penicillin-binding protein 2
VIGMPQDKKERKERRASDDFRDHALFVCFAPYKNPEIVVTVILENAGHGGSAAAPVARKIIDTYFSRENIMQSQPSQVQVVENIRGIPEP